MQAEAAFFGGVRPVIAKSLLGHGADASRKLAEVDADELRELLPYAIDPVGPGTRRAVLRDPQRSAAREAKRSSGVYYTPSDLADYMVGFLPNDPASLTLDPACGTGVFLDAVLRARWDLTDDKPGLLAGLYGLDLIRTSVEAACFTLAARTAPWFPTPAHAWHAARTNLAEVDTLSLGAGHPSLTGQLIAAGELRKALRAALREPIALPEARVVPRGDWPLTLPGLFPEAYPFDGLVGNPPYAPLGLRSDLAALSSNFESFRGVSVTATTNAFIPFVELMWGAVQPKGKAALVVPLSVAYNSSSAYRGLRRAIRASGGCWDFRFFDRTPDSIFGDDVKQRVAVLTRDGSRGRAFRTSSLHRWSSRQRATLFGDLPSPVCLPSLDDFLIPKLGTDAELALYTGVRRSRKWLGEDLQCRAARSRQLGYQFRGGSDDCLQLAAPLPL